MNDVRMARSPMTADVPSKPSSKPTVPQYGRSARMRQPSGAFRPSAARRIVVAALGFAMAFLFSAAAVQARTLRVVALGDSLTAGYMLPGDAAFPAQLEKALRAKGLDVEVANAGVSGDTASQGLARLDWSVPDGTDAVILELGANDALRGIDPSVTLKALDEILARLKARGVPVLMAGMYAPRNMGTEYIQAFDGVFPQLAAKHGAALYPFFLEGIAGDPKLNLKDGLHPTPEGVKVIVSRILPSVTAFLAGLKPSAS
jgi:acyl-CoA thioesterase-1